MHTAFSGLHQKVEASEDDLNQAFNKKRPKAQIYSYLTRYYRSHHRPILTAPFSLACRKKSDSTPALL